MCNFPESCLLSECFAAQIKIICVRMKKLNKYRLAHHVTLFNTKISLKHKNKYEKEIFRLTIVLIKCYM